jgi:predicted ribosome quality control (RQC) complex YloA/Tae2 family protein
MDGLTLRAMTAAALGRVEGRRVASVHWLAPAACAVGLGGGGPLLVVSADVVLGGIFTLPGPVPGRGPLPPHLEALRRLLKGAFLCGGGTAGLERVAWVEFRRTSPAGVARQHRLILEAMGRWSNLILTQEPEGVILTSLKAVEGSGGRRSVLPGAVYRLPPSARPDPAALSPPELATLAGRGGVDEAFLSGLAGVGRETARALSAAAAGEGALELLREAARCPPAEGVLGEDAAGRPVLTLRFGDGRPPEGRVGPLTELGAEYYRRAAARAALAARRDGLRSRLVREIRAAADLEAVLAREMTEAGREEEYRRWGEALLAHHPHPEKGATACTIPAAFGEEGVSLTIPLDPTLGAVANARRFFQVARRMRQRRERNQSRLEGIRARLAALRELEERLPAIATDRGLDEAEGLLPAGRGDGQAPPVPAPKTGTVRARPWLEYRLEGGGRVLVGRDARSNDLLTRSASPDDFWLHASGYRGAHVVVRARRGQSPPEGVLEQAASLAAFHSEGRGEGKVAVACLRRKEVRRPRGAAPGLVVLGGHRSILARPGVPPGARLLQAPGGKDLFNDGGP